MPAIMTHDLFGRDAYADARAPLGAATEDERDAFLLGNQGPDPLFYLVADPFVDASMRVGGLMHHERPARLLASLRAAVDVLPAEERVVGRAYAAGFVCHYLLDRTVHPLVYTWQYGICDAGVEGLSRADGSLVHAEIERDLDEMVLFERTGLTVRDHRPYREALAGSRRVLGVVDKLYFHTCLWTYGLTLDAGVYTRAVLSFRRVQRLFWSPGGTARAVLGAVERLVTGGRYSLYCAMAHRAREERTSAFANAGHRAWADPFTGERSAKGFWDLYGDARRQVPDAVAALCAPTFGVASARALTRGLNFSGMAVDEAAPVGTVGGE